MTIKELILETVNDEPLVEMEDVMVAAIGSLVTNIVVALNVYGFGVAMHKVRTPSALWADWKTNRKITKLIASEEDLEKLMVDAKKITTPSMKGRLTAVKNALRDGDEDKLKRSIKSIIYMVDNGKAEEAQGRKDNQE